MNYDQEIERRGHPENFLNYNPDELDEIEEDTTSMEEKLETLENLKRKCKRCGVDLKQGDDLICGYHWLEN